MLFSCAIVDWMVCGVSADLTHNRAFPCKSVAPGLLWYGAWAVFVLGLVVAGWRAYRDFVHGAIARINGFSEMCDPAGVAS